MRKVEKKNQSIVNKDNDHHQYIEHAYSNGFSKKKKKIFTIIQRKLSIGRSGLFLN